MSKLIFFRDKKQPQSKDKDSGNNGNNGNGSDKDSADKKGGITSGKKDFKDKKSDKPFNNKQNGQGKQGGQDKQNGQGKQGGQDKQNGQGKQENDFAKRLIQDAFGDIGEKTDDDGTGSFIWAGGGRLNWVMLESPRLVNTFVQSIFAKMGAHLKGEWEKFADGSKDAILARDKKWFGENMPATYQELEKLSEYRNFEQYKALKKEAAKRLRALKKLKKLDIIPTKKIAFNDRELGIFSFPAAAIQLVTEKDKNGNEIIVSQNKKSFAYFEPKESEKQFVRLYVTRPSSSAEGDADALVWKGIFTAIIVEELQSAGYDIEVVGINGTTDFDSFREGGYDFYATLTKYKKPETRFNINEFLLQCAEPAYLRHHCFKEQIALFHHFKKNNHDAQLYGSLTFDNNVPKIIGNINDGSKFMLINQIRSEQQMFGEIEKILTEIKNKTFLKKGFYFTKNDIFI